MSLKVSVPPFETLHLPNRVVVNSERRLEIKIDGHLPFLRERDYVHEDDTDGNLRAQFRYALQEYYLNGRPLENIYDAAEALCTAVEEVRPTVIEAMRYFDEGRTFKAIIFAARTLG